MEPELYVYVVCKGIRGEKGEYFSMYVPVYAGESVRTIRNRYRQELADRLAVVSNSGGGGPSPGDFRCSFSVGLGTGSS